MAAPGARRYTAKVSGKIERVSFHCAIAPSFLWRWLAAEGRFPRRAITPDLETPGMGLEAFYHWPFCLLGSSLKGFLLAAWGRYLSAGRAHQTLALADGCFRPSPRRRALPCPRTGVAAAP